MSREQIQAVRRFNRFYTQKIGILAEGHLGSGHSLTEARVLYELAHRPAQSAASLCGELGLDAGYLSRILKRFESGGLVSRTRSADDGRQMAVSLTGKGRRVFAGLDRASDEQVRRMLEPLDRGRREELRKGLVSVSALLEREPAAASVVLRPHRLGDMGYVVHRQAVLYGQEYGWDEKYEALVCEITAKFLRSFKPERERCWIAERDGEIVGAVFCVQESKTVARLRMLYVEQSARGMGLGRQLVQECISFARRCGYRKLTLWTNSVLKDARRTYERAGFVKVHEEPYPALGAGLAQTFDLRLDQQESGR
jgi:DNA-binding MarR family transcriptional regulator/GNAT superfamily N-acetyltransferase